MGCRGKRGCRTSRLVHFFKVLIILPTLFRRRRVVEPIIHHRRLSSLHTRERRKGELDSLSVSEVHDEEVDEKNCRKGEVDREGSGLDGAVDDSELRPDIVVGGNRKSGPNELLGTVNVARVLGCGVLAVSPESVSDELS
jgi:hypothetical protein